MNNYPKCILALLITFLSHAVQAQPTGKWGISARHKSGYITEGVGATVVDKSGSVFAAAIFTGDTVSFGSITLTRSIRGAGTQTIVVTKADSNGHYIWAKMIGAGYYSSVFSIAVDGYGCLYVYGTYRDSCNVDTFHLRNPYTTASANFLARISPTGNVLWAHNICAGEYQGTIGVDGANNIYLQGAYTASTVVIGGYTIPAYGGGDIYIAKINPAGGVLWARSFGGRSWETQNGIYSNVSMAVEANGTFYVSGLTRSDTLYAFPLAIATPNTSADFRASYIAAFNTNGLARWMKVFDAHVEVHSMTSDKAGNIYVCGILDSFASVEGHSLSASGGNKDVFFAKYDSLGNLVWVKRYGSSREQFAHSLAADSCGHIWMTGSLDLRDSVVFDGHAAVSDIWAYDPTFIAGFDTSGTCFDASAINTGGDDQLGIAVDRRGNFYISGDYIYGVAWSPFVIGPDTLTINNTPSSTEYFFIGKYRYDTSQCNTFTGGNDSTTAVTEVWQRQLHDIRLFPNPAGNQFTIASSELITSVTITDLTGNVLFIGEFQDEKIDITTAGFAPGLYFVCVNKSQMEKLVIY